MNNEQGYNKIYDLCKQHMHAYVLAETTDGTSFDGIITGLDDEYVYFAVPISPHEPMTTQFHYNVDDSRQFGYYGGYGYPGYGYPGYGYPYYGYPRPGYRFRRLVLPLTALAALSLLPWY